MIFPLKKKKKKKSYHVLNIINSSTYNMDGGDSIILDGFEKV